MSKEENKKKRKRYIELTQIAAQVVELIEIKGVEPKEGCILSAIAERMWDRQAPQDSPPAYLTPTGRLTGGATNAGS